MVTGGYRSQTHTDGDIYVFFPTHNVLVASDVVIGGSCYKGQTSDEIRRVR
jgi:glyoxylase-like metal-dependent hydrolase (beta-lactamase superfamily II)